MKYSKLRDLSEQSLLANVIEHSSGPYLAAGSHHFRSLWTRDFCFAVPGLLAIGREDVAKNHLGVLLNSLSQDEFLVPRILDSMPSALRVAGNCALNALNDDWSLPIKGKLKPEYVGEHGTPSFDSNLLTILSSLDYIEHTGDEQFWANHKEHIKNALRFYEDHKCSFLIGQPDYSDWQDSLKRKGATSYLNLLYLAVGKRLRKKGFQLEFDIASLEQEIQKEYFTQENMFSNFPDGDDYSLESQIFVLDFELFDEGLRSKLYESLKKSDLWTKSNTPGQCCTVNSAKDQQSWTTKLVGLGHYHGVMHWSWLMGYSAKAARKQNDMEEYDRILLGLEEIVSRDGVVYEIYDSNSLKPWRGALYRSERPFSWGAGKILESIS